MTLVQSWVDSLTLLKPKNAQLFIMVTLKSILEVYKIMFWYLWAAMGLVTFSYIFWAAIVPAFIGWHASDWRPAMLEGSIHWLYQFLIFISCVATRPSIMKKDWTYFKSQLHAFIYMIIIIVPLVVHPQHFWPHSFSFMYIFSTLFFLDSAGGPRNFLYSLWNALKMVVYNLPLLAMIGFLVWIWSLCYTHFIVPFVAKGDTVGASIALRDIVGVWFLPIGICLCANIYIKKLHDQFDLYFKPVQ